MENNSVKERLIAFIAFKGISKSEFCRKIGVSSAFVSSMRVSIQPDKLKSIAVNFPDLNTTWLMTGEGEMLRGGSTVVANNSGITAVNNTGRITASQDGSADNALANYAGMIEEIHNILLNEIATTRKELNAERDNFDNILSQQRAELMAIISKQNEHISALIGKLLDEK